MKPDRIRRRKPTFNWLNSIIIIIIITTTTTASIHAMDMTGSWWRPDIAGITVITIIITTTITTASTDATGKPPSEQDPSDFLGPVARWKFLFLPCFLLRRTVKMSVSSVEHRICRRCPLRPGRKIRSIIVDAARLKFAFGKFLRTHRLELEIGLFGNHDDLRKWLFRPEDMRTSLGRRLEDAEKHHRPPIPHQGRDRNRHGIAGIRVEARMRFGPDRHALLDLEIEQDLVGIKRVAKIPERRPLQTTVRRITPIALQNQMPVPGADMQFVVIRIEEFNPVLGAFRKRHTVPHLFA